MHFWIDKRSQGCGFNGRRLPPYIAGSQRWGVYPKLMVTPVHRFQSIECAGAGGVRHPRAPGYHTRFPVQCNQSVQYNVASANNSRNNVVVNRSMEILSNRETSTATPRISTPTATARLKCGVWVFFAIVTFFIAGAKYYFHGVNMGLEAFAFCSLLVVVLLVGGLVSLYEAMGSSAAHTNEHAQNSVQISSEQNDTVEDSSSQVPNNPLPMNANELPPPPYHIAIMLPSQTERESLTILRDSPPPSYDKAVT